MFRLLYYLIFFWWKVLENKISWILVKISKSIKGILLFYESRSLRDGFMYGWIRGLNDIVRVVFFYVF